MRYPNHLILFPGSCSFFSVSQEGDVLPPQCHNPTTVLHRCQGAAIARLANSPTDAVSSHVRRGHQDNGESFCWIWSCTDPDRLGTRCEGACGVRRKAKRVKQARH